MSVTVADLLRLSSLRNARVEAGRGGLSRIVASLSVLEYADPDQMVDAFFRNDDYYGSEIVIPGGRGAAVRGDAAAGRGR